MRFDLLRVRDLVLALLLGLLVLAPGLASRAALMERAQPGPVPAVAPEPEPPPPPPRIVRVITRTEPVAVLTDEPGDPRAVTRLRAGAVVRIVDPQSPARHGRRMIETQTGRRGWVYEESLSDEETSANAVALFDATDGSSGPELAARQGGLLHATPALGEHLGAFSRGEKLRKLRVEGKAWLVATSDGAGGRVVGYARATEVQGAPPRAVARPAVVAAAPASPGGASSDAGSAAGVAADVAADVAAPAAVVDETLEDARNEYAAGNFQDAERKADAVAKRGSEEGSLLAAMAACQQGNADKARRIAKQLTSPRLRRLQAACPALQPATAPPTPPDPAAPAEPAAPPAAPTAPAEGAP